MAEAVRKASWTGQGLGFRVQGSEFRVFRVHADQKPFQTHPKPQTLKSLKGSGLHWFMVSLSRVSVFVGGSY